MRERLIYIALIVTLLGVVSFMGKSCSSKEEQLIIANQNIEALMDSTRSTKNKLDQAQFEKKVFLADVETLRKLNAELVKEAEAQNGNTRVITKVVTKIVFDTIRIDNVVDRIDDSTFSIAFSYKRDFDSLNSISFNGNVPAKVTADSVGFSMESKSTTISDLSMNMKLYTGIKEDQGTYSIFARTDFPGVKFDLDGAVIDPEKSFVNKKSTFSLMLGGGIGYGMTQSGAGVFPNVGLYIGINLLNF